VSSEFEWYNLNSFRPLDYYTEFRKLIYLGAECMRRLELVKTELLKDMLVPTHFTELRASFIKLLYHFLSILRTYERTVFTRSEEEEEEEERKHSSPIYEITKDIELLVKYLTSHDVAIAVNNVYVSRTGEIQNIVGLMESILSGLIFDSIKETTEIITEEIPKVFIEEALKRGGIIPKFKYEKAKEISTGI